jgi:E3 ubiquitin-protein ligase CHFR
MNVANLIHSEPSEPMPTLKRRASSTFDTEEGSSRKRLRDEGGDSCTGRDGDEATRPSVDGAALADELEQELQCGCCAALVYRPVVVSPCQHFFCGR